MIDRRQTTPYIGLRRFEEDDSTYFFGRDDQIAALGKKLQSQRFVAIVGTSGCGKSSLLQAGLIPALKSNRSRLSRDRWAIISMRPGFQPLTSLAAALAKSADEQPTLQQRLASGDVSILEDQLRELASRDDRQNVLLVVDQFEEIFRFRERSSDAAHRDATREESAHFVSLLLGIAKSSLPVYVVVTMRSDFIGACDSFLGLPEALNQGQFLVPRLTREQLRQAVTGPPWLWGIRLDREFVGRILNDSAKLRITEQAIGESTESADDLPLLQHALMRTWESWWDETTKRRRSDAADVSAATSDIALGLAHTDIQQLDASSSGFEPWSIEHVRRVAEEHPPSVKDYETAGGIDGALTRHAREALSDAEKALPGRGRSVVRRIFQILTDTDVAGLRTRRPARIGELVQAIGGVIVEDVAKVLEPFARSERSFIVIGGPLSDASTSVDICHESLIRRWEDLDKWSVEEAASVSMYRDLSRSAADYTLGRTSYWTNPKLTLARRWRARNRPTEAWGKRRGSDFHAAMRFLRWSLIWHYVRITAWVAAVVLVLAGVSFAAWRAGQTTESNRLAAEANRMLDLNPLASVRLAVQAVDIYPLPVAVNALENAMNRAGGRTYPSDTAVISPNGHWLVSPTPDQMGLLGEQTLRLGRWDLERLDEKSRDLELGPTGTDRPQVAIGTNRAAIAWTENRSGVQASVVEIVDIEKWKVDLTLDADAIGLSDREVIKYLQVSMRDSFVIVGTTHRDAKQDRIIRCDLQPKAACEQVKFAGAAVAAMHIGDELLGLVGSDGGGNNRMAEIVELKNPTTRCRLDGVTALTFTREGALLTGSSDGAVQVYNSIRPPCTPERRLLAHSDSHAAVTALAALNHQTGRWVVVGDSSGGISLHGLSGQEVSIPLRGGGGGPVANLNTDAAGHWIVAALQNSNAAILWDLGAMTVKGEGLSPSFARGDGSPRDLLFSSDSHWLLTTDDEGSHLWDLRAPDPAFRTVLHRPHPQGDSSAVALGKQGNSLWQLSAKQLGAAVCPLVPNVEQHIDSDEAHTHDGPLSPSEPSRDIFVSSPDGAKLVRFPSSEDRSPRNEGGGFDFWVVGAELEQRSARPQGAPISGRLRLVEQPVPLPTDVTAAAFSGNSRGLVLGTSSGTIRVWNATDIPDRFVDVRISSGRPIKAVALNLLRETVVATVDQDGEVNAVQLRPDGKQTQLLKDFANERSVLLTINPEIAFSSDGQWLLVRASVAPLAYVFDLSKSPPERRDISSKTKKGYSAAALVPTSPQDPTTRWLIVGRVDGLVDVFDFRTWRPNREWQPKTGAGHNGPVTTIAISPDGRFVTGGADGRVVVSSVRAPEQDRTVLEATGFGVDRRNDPMAAALFVDSDRIVTISRSGLAREWLLNHQSLVEQSKRVAGQDLLPDEKMRYLPAGDRSLFVRLIGGAVAAVMRLWE